MTIIRRSIALYCESESPFIGEVELDESYFGAKRVRGKRGRGARGKMIVFGIYKRNGCVYTEIVPNCSRRMLYAIIKGKVDKKSTKWYGLVTDIEGRKRVEESLRHSEDSLAEAQRLSRVGSVEMEVTTERIFWSDESARIYGYAPGTEAAVTVPDNTIHVILIRTRSHPPHPYAMHSGPEKTLR